MLLLDFAKQQNGHQIVIKLQYIFYCSIDKSTMDQSMTHTTTHLSFIFYSYYSYCLRSSSQWLSYDGKGQRDCYTSTV